MGPFQMTTIGQAKPEHEVTSVSTPPNHLMCNGDFILFVEWCFIHRTCLDSVPPNGTCHFRNGTNDAADLDTLTGPLHVLNH
jgi:hypothetical protein